FNQTKSPKEQSFADIEQQLRTKIAGQLQAVLKAIRLFDYNRDGQIQRHELRRVVENFCFRLTNEQFDRLWCKYDLTRNGHTLDYMDFLKRLGVNTHPKRRPSTANRLNQGNGTENKVKFLATNKRPLSGSSSRDGSPAVMTVKDLERKLRAKMVENFENIQRAFVAFDRRCDGFVTLDQLKRILTHFVFPMSDSLFEDLMRRCGIRASHKIGYEQFLEKFQDPRVSGNGQTIPIKPNHKFNPVREAEDMPTTEDIWKFLFSKVTDSFTSVKQAFLVFDDNKDGRITRRDFRRILESFCFRMTEEQFHELMAKIDPMNRGYISYLEFLDRFEHRESPVLDSLGLYMTDDQYRILSARLGFHKGKLTYRDFLDNFQDRRSIINPPTPDYPSKRHNQPVPLDQSMTAELVLKQLKNKLSHGFL
ncbi:predicted protein, partial [Nematostella vectensis]